MNLRNKVKTKVCAEQPFERYSGLQYLRSARTFSERIIAKHAYKVGDNVIIKSWGAGKVTRNDNGKLMVQDNRTGTRFIVTPEKYDEMLADQLSKDDATKILFSIKPKNPSASTWNRRFRELQEKLLSGDANLLADAVSELAALRKDKDLSYGEKKMFQSALMKLTSILAVPLGMTPESLEEKILKKLENA